MGIESNKEAYQTMQNSIGSMENRMREIYNKGYKDGIKEGINQAMQKIADSILEEVKTEPQTEEYCDKCNHKGCDTCVADASNPYCVPSNYKPKDEPQTNRIADKKPTPIRDFMVNGKVNKPQTERSE